LLLSNSSSLIYIIISAESTGQLFETNDVPQKDKLNPNLALNMLSRKRRGKSVINENKQRAIIMDIKINKRQIS
jgi:hypothetical protein